MLYGRTSRRLLLAGGVAGAGLLSARAHTRPRPIPALPLAFAVAVQGGKPVVSAAWLQRQLLRAQQLMQPHGVSIQQSGQRELSERFAKLEDAEDRDALAAELQTGVINAFIVASLRDVDDPKLMRMGVRWRQRRNVSKDYVIVAARALPTTLCHELGHYLGNGHSRVVNNVMSYRRDDPAAVRFDKHQGARMRRVARRLLARRKLVPLVSEEKR